MGYPQFNKVTIQLPLPDSTMTKAEYKNAYGIDLDSIDFPKVTIIVDGKNKYPVDEIKIVSDDVLIFAGGKILTIGDDGNVSVTAGVYSIENAKPIYCHPITCFNQNSPAYFMFTCLIFNNNPEPFTVETLKSFIDSLPDNASIMASGYCKTTDKEVTSISYIGRAGTSYIFDGGKYNETAYERVMFAWNDIIGRDTTRIADGVNKIN